MMFGSDPKPLNNIEKELSRMDTIDAPFGNESQGKEGGVGADDAGGKGANMNFSG